MIKSFEHTKNSWFQNQCRLIFLVRDDLEYLGLKRTRQGIIKLSDKVQAIKDIAVPTNKQQLTSYIGVINYYRDMWKHRSDILTPLTKITSKQDTWNWTKECQKAFEHMKKSISRETLLIYPIFSKPLSIHTDASNKQLGTVISQDNKPIAFYSRIPNPTQISYTTTEIEPSSIVETLNRLG